MKATEVFSKEEIRQLAQTSDLRGWQAVATTWLMIGGSLALVAAHPATWTVLFALVIIGGRFLALGILMHDASHYSLFRTRKLNDIVGQWICAAPGWQDLRRYRKHHLAHHQLAGTDRDPDLSLVAPFPITRASLARKALRDLSGLTGLKRVYGLLMMDFGYAHYTVAADVRPIDARGRSKSELMKTGWRNLHPTLITNIILFGLLWALGKPWLYAIWALAYLTTFSLIIRIRSIAEHACTGMDPDPWVNTRTTLASPLARVTVAPHRVNFHLEHHLLMTVPYFNLPKMHRRLRESGKLQGAHLARNYVEVLKLVTSQNPANSR